MVSILKADFSFQHLDVYFFFPLTELESKLHGFHPLKRNALPKCLSWSARGLSKEPRQCAHCLAENVNIYSYQLKF